MGAVGFSIGIDPEAEQEGQLASGAIPGEGRGVRTAARAHLRGEAGIVRKRADLPDPAARIVRGRHEGGIAAYLGQGAAGR